MSESIATALNTIAVLDESDVGAGALVGQPALPDRTPLDPESAEAEPSAADPLESDPSAFIDESKEPATPSWHTTKRLYWLLRPFWGTVCLLLLLSLLAVAVELVPPLLQGRLVDLLVRAESAMMTPGPALWSLTWIVAGLLVIRVAATLVGIYKGKAANRVGASLTAYLRNLLVERLSFLPLAFHNRNQVGALMSRVAYDTETLHTLVFHMTGGLLLQSLQLGGIGAMLFYLNPKLALVTLLPMPLIAAGSWYFTRYLQPRYNHYWEAVGKQAGGLTGMLTGIRVVKTFAQEEREITRFNRASQYLCNARQTVDGSIVTFTSVMGFVFASGGLAVWYIGGRDVLFGKMSLGSLVAFLAYLAMFYAPLSSIAESMSWFSSFFASVDRIFGLLETPMEGSRQRAEGSSQSKQPKAAPSLPTAYCPQPTNSRGGVEFRNVSFAYDKTKPVLKDVSFCVEPGEMVGIVGRSGSGKSTLVSLIARLYETGSGKVFVGGVDNSQVSPRELRRHIGMVQQEPFLFRGSVLENIAYGNTSAEPEEILLAARQADAHGFIMRQPFAYETQLGEGGAGLSGGERQRLSIARALLIDPDILILDEATASIDAESERAICAAIRRFSRRRTTIAIAHRLSTLRSADRLLVFDQGHLVEQGSHDDLMAADGLYASLVRLQYSSGPVEDIEEEGTSLPWLEPAETEISRQNAEGRGQRAEGGGQTKQPQAASSLPTAYCLPPARDEASLTVSIGGKRYENVVAAPCFPATRPDSFISVRRLEDDGRETELGIIRSLSAWPLAARAAVAASIANRQVLEHVQSIGQMQTRGSLLEMRVATRQGNKTILLDKSGDANNNFTWQSYGRRGFLLTDTTGSRFIISDCSTLPKHQQQLLSLYFGEQI